MAKEEEIRSFVEKTVTNMTDQFRYEMRYICEHAKDEDCVLNIFTNVLGNFLSQAITDLIQGACNMFDRRIQLRDELAKKIVEVALHSLNINEKKLKNVRQA